MSAYAILDRVRTSGISHPPTVYRALNELMQKGMVHRLQSRSAFIACGHGACDGKFAFAICRQCDKVVEIPLSDEDQATVLLGSRPMRSRPSRSRSSLPDFAKPAGRPDSVLNQRIIEMRSERGSIDTVMWPLSPTAPGGASSAATRRISARAGFPLPGLLLRMSVPARLVMVAAASLLLWVAVAWALS